MTVLIVGEHAQSDVHRYRTSLPKMCGVLGETQGASAEETAPPPDSCGARVRGSVLSGEALRRFHATFDGKWDHTGRQLVASGLPQPSRCAPAAKEKPMEPISAVLQANIPTAPVSTQRALPSMAGATELKGGTEEGAPELG